MLRIQEIKLPLDHPEPALRQAILKRLSISDSALTAFTIFKRSYDARKKSAIQLIYMVDCDVKDEAAVLKRLAKDKQIGPTPNLAYVPPHTRRRRSSAPGRHRHRPVRPLRRLILAEMGFARSSSTAARSCASARKTPGASGARAC
jgi:uncharacterized FAD-dependent dehydrogenase